MRLRLGLQVQDFVHKFKSSAGVNKVEQTKLENFYFTHLFSSLLSQA